MSDFTRHGWNIVKTRQLALDLGEFSPEASKPFGAASKKGSQQLAPIAMCMCIEDSAWARKAPYRSACTLPLMAGHYIRAQPTVRISGKSTMTSYLIERVYH